MNNVKVVIRVFIYTLVVYSCAPAYIPNAVNTPMLKNKGDLKIGGSLGTSGADLNSAYALTNNIGIMINGSVKNGESEVTIGNGETKVTKQDHSIVEFGLGSFRSFSNGFTTDIFAGIGYGNVETTDKFGLHDGILKGDYNKFFIQPSLGVVAKYIEGAVSVRFSGVKMDLTPYGFKDKTDVEYLYKKNKELVWFYEPTLTARFGSEKIKGVFQVGYSARIKDSDIHYFDHEPFIFNMGVQFSVNKFFE